MKGIKGIINVLGIGLLIFSLAACNSASGNTGEKDAGATAQNLLDENNLGQEENEFVSLRIEDGIAYAYFNLENWETQYEIYDYLDYYYGESGRLVDEEIMIGVLGDDEETLKVVDAKIGDFPMYGTFQGQEYVPMGYFLLEDGTVTWAYLIPYIVDEDYKESYPYMIYGGTRISWVEDIQSLDNGASKRAGLRTVYGTSKSGKKISLEAALEADFSSYVTWSNYIPQEDNPEVFDKIVFGFTPNNYAAVMRTTSEPGGPMELYEGTLKTDFTANGKSAYGKIILDLELTETTLDKNYSAKDKRLKSTVSLEMDPSYEMIYLNHERGDRLMAGFTSGVFYSDWEESLFDQECEDEYTVWDATDAELFDYMRGALPEVEQMVDEYGMSFFVDSYSQYISDEAGVGIGIWLGTDSEESFVKEIFYAMDRYFNIYKMDAVSGDFVLVVAPVG